MIMNDPCCYNNSTVNFYNIDNVQERYIPTYCHTQIFTAQKAQPMKVRYTPTFQSNILPSDPKRHHKNFIELNRSAFQSHSAKKMMIRNVSKQKKPNQFYYTKGRCNLKSDQLWYDLGKSELFDNMALNRNYPKDRKLIDLSSAEVFDAGKITIAQIQHRQQEQQVRLNTNPQICTQTEPEQQPIKQIPQVLIQNTKHKKVHKQQFNKAQNQKLVQQIAPKNNIKEDKRNTPKVNKNIKLSHVIQGYPRFTIIRNKPF